MAPLWVLDLLHVSGRLTFDRNWRCWKESDQWNVLVLRLVQTSSPVVASLQLAGQDKNTEAVIRGGKYSHDAKDYNHLQTPPTPQNQPALTAQRSGDLEMASHLQVSDWVLLTCLGVGSVPPGSSSSGSCPFSLLELSEETPPPSASFSKKQTEQEVKKSWRKRNVFTIWLKKKIKPRSH